MAFLGLIKRATRIRRNNSRVRVYPARYFQSRDLSNKNFFPVEDAKLPVLIAGAGPVGLVLSILLTKLGVKCAVVAKATSFSKHPQAHFINNRSMEIFRKLDGLAGEIERSQPPVDLWRKFIYCTSLSGSTLGTVDHMQPQDFEKVVSPASVAHFSQYKLTSLMLKRLEDLGFNVQSFKELDGLELDSVVAGKILMGHECVAIDANKESVTATVSFVKRRVYLEGAIVPDNESGAGDPEVPSGRRRDYVPCAEPGSRLPHMYVKILSDSTREVIVSTLDLVSTEKVEFLLIISPLQESYELARATIKVAKECMANVKACVVWPSSSNDGVERESKSALAPWENFVHVMEVKEQSGEEASWWNICKISEKGSILVRPDEHIAWRMKSSVPLDPTLHMRDVFAIILGKQ